MTHVKQIVATVLVTLACTLPLALGFTAVQVNTARANARADQRASDVALCDAINIAVPGGMAKLVKQLRVSTETSKQRTPQEKAATEAFYTLLLQDFPKLDCSTSPIEVVTSVPVN